MTESKKNAIIKRYCKEFLNAVLNESTIELVDAYSDTGIDTFTSEQLLKDEEFTDCEIANFEVVAYDGMASTFVITIYDDTHPPMTDEEEDEFTICTDCNAKAVIEENEELTDIVKAFFGI